MAALTQRCRRKRKTGINMVQVENCLLSPPPQDAGSRENAKREGPARQMVRRDLPSGTSSHVCSLSFLQPEAA